MIRKSRTRRDNQQWMLDLAINMRGRAQNFEADSPEAPPGKRPRNYRMYSKVFREAAEHDEALAKRAPGQPYFWNRGPRGDPGDGIMEEDHA
ncbi:MAG: hypothetical protein IT529_12620 [Burkholderiales bacterium]|nr:hypothetical protein [Burkholderiales bacterium]